MTPDPCRRCTDRPATVRPYWAAETELCGPCATAVAALLDEHDRWPPVPWDSEEIDQ